MCAKLEGTGSCELVETMKRDRLSIRLLKRLEKIYEDFDGYSRIGWRDFVGNGS